MASKSVRQIALSVLVVLGCSHTPPLSEYAIARTAIEQAKRYESARYAPGFFHKAEEAYRKGEVAFRAKEYSEAADQFDEARYFAEKSENAARIQRFESGEEAP